MNLKKTFLSLMAAGTLLMGGAGVANAQTQSSTTWGSVTVNAGGEFTPYFCNGNVDFGTVNLTTTTVNNPDSRTGVGRATICYTDTKPDRPTFVTNMSATDFVDGSNVIPATNASIKTTFNPQQGQNSTAVCGAYNGTNRPCIGDIGAFNGTTSNYAPGGYLTSGGGDWGGVTWAGGNLAQNPAIAYGWNGAGTASQSPWATDTRLYWGSYHNLDLKVVVPQNASAGTYWSTLKIDVHLGVAP